MFFELRGVDGSNEGLAQVQLVNTEIDLQELIDQVQHPPALREFIRRATV